jgi:hypothetical protein
MANAIRSTFSRYQEKIKVGMTLEKNFYPEQRVFGRGRGRWTGILATQVYSPVSYQRSAFSHQLNERIQKVMIEDSVDHFASDSPNFLFLLKADCG